MRMDFVGEWDGDDVSSAIIVNGHNKIFGAFPIDFETVLFSYNSNEVVSSMTNKNSIGRVS